MPERDRRRCPLRIDNVHIATADIQNPPRRVAQQKDVAGLTFNRKVFIERTNDGAIGVGDNAVRRDFGNRSAVGHRSDACPLTRAQPTADAVVMQINPAVTGRTCHPFAEQFDGAVELLARQVAIRMRPTAERE